MSIDNAQATPAPEGHDAAMAAAFDNAQASATAPADAAPAAPAAPAAERPSWLPAEFETPEAMAEAYGKLAKPAAPAETTETAPDENAAKEAVTNAGLDFDALQTEFHNTGSLSAETYASLESKGLSKAVVDSYIAGQQALADQLSADVFGTVGGADAYAEMVGWASTNLSAAQIAAYDRAMDSGDIETIKLAVEGLQTRFQGANGAEPKLLNGGSGSTIGDTFGSTAELTAAMRDPRYGKDPAYRAEVQSKLQRSNSVF